LHISLTLASKGRNASVTVGYNAWLAILFPFDLSPALQNDLFWDCSSCKPNEERQYQEIVEMAKHRDKIRNKIDREDGIGDRDA
jgi:hypothetical protein